jgi:hypothetical protein
MDPSQNAQLFHELGQSRGLAGLPFTGCLRHP